MPNDLSRKFPGSLADLPVSEPLGDLVSSYTPAELWTIKNRRSVLGRRDSGRFDVAPSTLASGGIGLAPGSGIADVLGLLPDFERGGFHRGLASNLMHGDFGAAGWQALGAIGDGLYLLPALGVPLGIAAKTPRAVQIGKWAKYADKYPEAGPPTLHDKVTNKKISVTSQAEADGLVAQGKAYRRKALSPEIEELARDRRAIQSDMDRNGYTPFFDLAKRSDVDPKNYPTDVNTSLDSMPVKLATVEKYREAYQTDEAVKRLVEGYQEGKKIPEAHDWSAVKQLEDAYIMVLGSEVGRERFKKEFADMMAATTAGNTPTANFLMAHYASVMNQLGLRLPKHGYETPYPIGGGYAARNLAQAQKQLDTGAGFGAANPKRHDFSGSILGHTNMPPVDSVMSNAIVPGMNAPRYYGPASELLKIVAEKLGVDARHFQDLSRAGLQKLRHDAKHTALSGNEHQFRPDGPLIKVINDSIERTHRLTGRPREEIVELGLVLKKIPMYGIGGAAVAPMAGYGLGDLTSDNNSFTRDGSL